MSIPAAVFVYILAQNDLFWDKLSLTGCLISNYCWAVLSFENSQPTLGGKILAPIEVQRDETTLLIALLHTCCCWGCCCCCCCTWWACWLPDPVLADVVIALGPGLVVETLAAVVVDVKALGCAELPEDPPMALELVLLPVPVKELRLAALPSRLLAATPRDVAAANWLLGS